ncbi:hypothetical protein TFLX_05525 [Thermoflexales bacterium]|nr:hypothetical protein TFLX_05525 [Thermoflexales bacterium]
MAESTEVASILAIDIGSVNTQAVLIALVEGTYRFVARAQSPTTQEEPWADVAIGVRHAVEQLQHVSGRPLLTDDGNVISPEHDDGSGADLCVVTSSAAQPLRLVLAGLVGELSLESVRRAAAGTYSSVEDVISLLGTGRKSDEMRAKSILAVQPDVVCIAGGTDGGSRVPVLNLVESVALGASLIEPTARPTIVYAGNSALRARVKEIIGNDISLVAVEGNVRPALGAEDLGPLQAELDALHANTKLSEINGLSTCAAWSNAPVVSTARSFGNIVRYLSMIGDPRAGALGVDVGASNTTVGAAFNGKLQMTVRSDMGSAFGGLRLLSEAKVANVMRWLPFQIHPADLEAFVIDKELRPLTIPADGRELLIEQALAREAIRTIVRLARPSWRRLASRGQGQAVPLFERIIGAGAVIAKATRPGQAALLLLDALEPIGVFELLLDVYGLMPALGAAAVAHPLSVVQTIENKGLMSLGTVVVPTGAARPGEVILSLRITYEGGGDLEVEVAAGTLEVLPLPLGQKATLRLQPRKGIDIGHVRKSIPVEGGALGLIVDARGRPLTRHLPADPEMRRDQIQQWLWDMGA